MSDSLDVAKKLEEEHLKHSLDALRSRREKPLVVDGERLCLNCEIAISQQRIEAVDAVRCIECQTFHEIKHKNHGG